MFSFLFASLRLCGAQRAPGVKIFVTHHPLELARNVKSGAARCATFSSDRNNLATTEEVV
jgi:hypothetical protein